MKTYVAGAHTYAIRTYISMMSCVSCSFQQARDCGGGGSRPRDVFRGLSGPPQRGVLPVDPGQEPLGRRHRALHPVAVRGWRCVSLTLL